MGAVRPAHPRLAEGKQINRFQIESHIGHGGYGDIYSVRDSESGDRYAIKIEYVDAQKQALVGEIRILLKVQDSIYFPRIVSHGVFENFRFATMTLLGPSISNMRRSLPGRKYTMYSVLRLSIEMVRCIEDFHRHGYIHRDIKPGNFLIRPNRFHPVCLIDFGLSQAFTKPNSTKHLGDAARVGFTGTWRYASLHAHDQRRLSRRDDLISWFYAVMELADGKLPWPVDGDHDQILALKQSLTAGEMCAGLPGQFKGIWRTINALKFKEEPDYHGIREAIRQAMRDGHLLTGRFDWETIGSESVRSAVPLEMEEGSGDDESAPSEGGCVGCSVA
jgi:serine/threonine protein kinase